MNKKLVFLLWLCLAAQGFDPGRATEMIASGASTPYLRIWCVHSGNTPGELPGAWPSFVPAHRLASSGSSTPERIIVSNLLPLSTVGYGAATGGVGKFLLQKITMKDEKESFQTVSTLAYELKANGFYSLAIFEKAGQPAMELFEDQPATEPRKKDDKETPPPKRSLRCLVFEPETSIEITSAKAGLSLKASTGKVSSAQNLPSGFWVVEYRGLQSGNPFQGTLDVDLEAPANWTVLFMKNNEGRLVPFLQKDASLD